MDPSGVDPGGVDPGGVDPGGVDPGSGSGRQEKTGCRSDLILIELTRFRIRLLHKPDPTCKGKTGSDPPNLNRNRKTPELYDFLPNINLI